MNHTNHKSCSSCDSKCLIKEYCSDESVELVNRNKYHILYERRKNIITEGTPVLGTYFIQNGVVKVGTPGLNHKSQIIRLATSGDILAHPGSKGNTYHINAIAKEDAATCFIDNDVLNKLLLDNPAFTYALMTYYSGELRKLETQIKVLTQTKSAKQRIAETLLTLIEDFGMNEHNELNISLYRREIAELSGICTEGVIRVLSEFEKEKIIVKGKNLTISNVEILKQITQEINEHEFC